MATLNELLARRAQLKTELESVEAAISAFADQTPVHISTGRNIRNTWGLTTNPERVADGLFLVFADQTLSAPADQADHEGWMPRSSWKAFQLAFPEANVHEGRLDPAAD